MSESIWTAYPLIDQKIKQVKEIMVAELKLSNHDIQAKIEEYIHAPGKYLRAGLCLMFALIKEGEIKQDKLYLAAAIETFHLATLVHDDVIDESPLRRTIQTMHRSHSNRIAIYAGDYLLVMAGRILSKSSFNPQSEISFKWVANSILDGELLQLSNLYNPQINFRQYMKQIRGKTALLFALATYAGYYDEQAPQRLNKKAFYIGEDIGMLFQLTDDLIDYQSPSMASGKPRLQDIKNGNYSAPVLFALDNNPQMLDQYKHQPNLSDQDCENIYQEIYKCGGIEATSNLVQRYRRRVQRKLDHLTGYEAYKGQLIEILDCLVGRQR